MGHEFLKGLFLPLKKYKAVQDFDYINKYYFTKRPESRFIYYQSLIPFAPLRNRYCDLQLLWNCALFLSMHAL